MSKEKMLSFEEAVGVINILTKFLLSPSNEEMTKEERKGVGRMLSEVHFTIEVSGGLG